MFMRACDQMPSARGDDLALTLIPALTLTFTLTSTMIVNPTLTLTLALSTHITSKVRHHARRRPEPCTAAMYCDAVGDGEAEGGAIGAAIGVLGGASAAAAAAAASGGGVAAAPKARANWMPACIDD